MSIPQKININYKISFVDIFLFVNNKWRQKIFQLLLVNLLYATGNYLFVSFKSKSNIDFINIFFANLVLFSLVYLLFLLMLCYNSVRLDHWSKDLKIDENNLEFQMKNSKIMATWETIIKAKIGWNKYFYLYYNKSQAHIVPFRAFTNSNEIENFKDILQSKNIVRK